MKKQSPKIIFFGNERLATGVTTTCPTLQALLKAGYDVVAVVLHNQSATSRSQRAVEIAELAKLHHIPILMPHKLSSIVGDLAALKAEVGVLVAFGKIIPQAVIDIFPKGILNIHPSQLPKHRGPTPLESVILSGENQTAVSLMKLTAEMDAGPVYAQQLLSVPGTITKQSLADSVSQIGSKLVIQHLLRILDGSLQPQPQNHQQATYDSLISKTDGELDWTRPATMLERQIRAYCTWPKSRTTIGAHQLIITSADVINTSDISLFIPDIKAGQPGEYHATKKELVVYCGEDALRVRTVQPVNKKEMPIQAFLSGYQLQLPL